jgi:hypothetical protein
LLLALLASSCSCSSFWRRTKYKRREQIPWLVADTILYHPLSRPSHVDSPPLLPFHPFTPPRDASLYIVRHPSASSYRSSLWSLHCVWGR